MKKPDDTENYRVNICKRNAQQHPLYQTKLELARQLIPSAFLQCDGLGTNDASFSSFPISGSIQRNSTTSTSHSSLVKHEEPSLL